MLDQIESTLGLNASELAALFGVRRPSVYRWRKMGIPRARVATAERLLDLARVLAREMEPSRIPQVVRTKDRWFDGHTILETIAQSGVEPVYGYLHRLFAYQR